MIIKHKLEIVTLGAFLFNKMRCKILMLMYIISISDSIMIRPRLKIDIKDYVSFNYTTKSNNVVIYQDIASGIVYVGTIDTVYVINFYNKTSEVINIYTNNIEHPENAITFIGSFKNETLICGSDNLLPKCWKIKDYKLIEQDGRGLSPFTKNDNQIVLTSGNAVYSTISKSRHASTRLRRVVGNPELYASDSAMLNPKFIELVAIDETNHINDTIYAFFVEEGTSKVARVCSSDIGSEGSLSAYKWSTLLKTIIKCRNKEGKNYKYLVYIRVIKSSNPDNVKIYGLFLDRSNNSAICVFMFRDLQNNFNSSPLRGFVGKMPSVRPGTCLDKKHTPRDTFRVIDSYPETENNVGGSFIFESSYLYTGFTVLTEKIRHKNKDYNITIFYLATNDGKMHKVCHYKDGVLDIVEVSIRTRSSRILDMLLGSKYNILYITYNDSIISLPLAFCEYYGTTCNECLLARDPHCSWVNRKCTSSTIGKKLLQYNIDSVPSTICLASRTKHTTLTRNVFLEDGSYHVLSCPRTSYHAKYVWRKENNTIVACGIGDCMCNFIIDDITDKYGNYTCIMEEGWVITDKVIENIKKLR
ncbi:semaphorin-like protein [Turkeypox virus]|uniref:Semaphorin-like protein n=1 Tax=Turkeypox virus TaxID=336486 RepID=A0A0M3ZHS2_9POXV|nr:semaphorin-like protein [Turkeypox virus]ALA62399.1 semaphorin-like protein [Turkeypox virus]